jgi:hypothetical protein
MDQLKNILKPVLKYHFWLLCVVAIIASMVGWFMARKSLTNAYNQKKTNILGKFSSLSNLNTQEDPPNDEWKTGISKLNEEQKKSVAAAWNTVYDEQKKVLQWPEDLLGAEFVKAINEHPPNWQISPPKLLAIYQEKVKDAFPRLLKIIDAAASDPKIQATLATEEKPGAEPHEYTITWAGANQKQVLESLEWANPPSSTEVRRAQEDLWVYTALFTIIHAVNAEKRYNAPVKNIASVLIGREAADVYEEGMRPGHILSLRGADAPAGGTPPSDPGAAQPAAVPEGGDPAAAKNPLDGRYVDASGKRMPGATAAAVQFKRMPIFMRLTIDQREIPKLLTECANSPLPVEVRQLRINPGKAGGSEGSKSAPAASGGGNPLRLKLPGGSASARSTPGPSTTAASFEVPVEVLGIVYIYNKPEMNKPGGQPADDGGAVPAGGG